jgi:hypothetical protein
MGLHRLQGPSYSRKAVYHLSRVNHNKLCVAIVLSALNSIYLIQLLVSEQETQKYECQLVTGLALVHKIEVVVR